MKTLRVLIIENPCKDCGAPTLGNCEKCGIPICMECYRRYEWLLVSTLCWECKAEQDQEWLSSL